MSAPAELHYLSIAEAARRIARRELSPVELTEAHLARIEALNGSLHAYLEVTAEAALAAARRAERQLAEGTHLGPLHGIPIALKDNYDTAGLGTTAGSKIFRERVPDVDATTTARLKAAGGVLLGKLAMSELAMTGPPGFGEDARNPWNRAHVPGYSSSGSGVAVAAGLCAAALGSDTGGSIRFPASHNGIVGLLPSNGRVSRFGVVPLSATLDNAGPLARTVEDTAIVLAAIAGRDENDPTSSPLPVPDYRESLREGVEGMRVGVMGLDAQGLHPEVAALVGRAIGDLEALGARLEDVRLPLAEHAHVAGSIIYLAEGFSVFDEPLRSRSPDIGQVFRIYGYLGALFTAADYIQAQRLRSRLKKELARVFERVDVLALPVTNAPPGRVTDFDPFVLSDAARSGDSEVFNLTGAPAISVPCGFTAEGLPVGLQLAGRPFAEANVLRAAYAYEHSHEWHSMHPPV